MSDAYEGEVSGEVGLEQVQQVPVRSSSITITREEVEQLIKEEVRRAQASLDKGLSSVTKRVEKQLKAMEEYAAAVGASRDDIVAMRRQIIADAARNIPPEEEEVVAKQPSVPQEFNLEEAERAAEVQFSVARLNRQYGFYIHPDNDPEARNLDLSTPDAFLASYTQQMKAKARRLGKPIPEGVGPSPEARISSVTSAPPAGNTIDQLTAEHDRLLNKHDKTAAEWKRLDEVGQQLLAYLK